jgi:hypothetical protein
MHYLPFRKQVWSQSSAAASSKFGDVNKHEAASSWNTTTFLDLLLSFLGEKMWIQHSRLKGCVSLNFRQTRMFRYVGCELLVVFILILDRGENVSHE